MACVMSTVGVRTCNSRGVNVYQISSPCVCLARDVSLV